MSLTVERLHKLRGKGFEELYNNDEERWKEMVENAKTYAKTCVGEGDKIRPGDVAEIIQSAIKIDKKFEDHVKNKGLQQKYWVAWFADYVMDRAFPPPDIQ